MKRLSYNVCGSLFVCQNIIRLGEKKNQGTLCLRAGKIGVKFDRERRIWYFIVQMRMREEGDDPRH